jgi:anti-sigma regulatory factor (Ser/Thr protein kinase)
MPDTSSDGFRHALSAYSSADAAAHAAIPYLVEGRDAHDTLVVHVSPPVLECLAASVVGAAVDRATVLGDVVNHPHQMLWTLRQLGQDARRDDRRLRVLFEIDASAHDPLDWARAETAANAVLADLPVRALCLCDVRAAHRLALADLMCAHPEVWRDGVADSNAEYIETRNHLRALDSRRSPDPLEAWPARERIPLRGLPELAAVRAALEPMLDAAGIGQSRREDFLEGVFQVCVNAIMHGGDKAEVRLWDTEASVLCRVRDDGQGLVDPLMGYVPPSDSLSEAGTSLWAARQLCDHLTTTFEPEGFTVRMTVSA